MFLATTADQRFWKTDEKILFLGEWCRVYDQKSAWSKIEHEVFPYHWNDSSKFNQDAQYLNDLYDKVISDLTTQLNNLHNVDYPRRYWQIILGSWLVYFIETFYDRFTSICSATDTQRITHTWLPKTALESFIPRDFEAFRFYCVEDSYNLLMYGWIIKHLNKIPYEVKNEPNGFSLLTNLPLNSEPYWNTVLKKIIEGCSRWVPDNMNHIVFYDSCIQPWHLFCLQLSLRQAPYIRGPKIKSPDYLTDFHLRKKLSLSFATNSFESLLEKVIPIQIPKAYIEGYFDLHHKALETFPKSPKIILSALGLYSNEIFKFWTAWHVNRGTKLISSQHGGSYGSCRVMSIEKNEVRSSDQFFSWGWDEPDSKNVIPMPSGQLAGKVNLIKTHSKGQILFVGSETPRYSRSMQSISFGPRMLELINEEKIFVKHLKPEVKKILALRLHPLDREWGLKKRWEKFDEEILVCNSKQSMYQQLSGSRLFIGSFNSTCHLESLAANFPTIIFWNPDLFQLRESAKTYHEELQRAGIYHDTPESAAAKVNEIFEDPLTWWHSPEIQNTRDNFCQQFAWTTKTWRAEWKNALLKIAND